MTFNSALARVSGFTLFGSPANNKLSAYDAEKNEVTMTLDQQMLVDGTVSKKAFGKALVNFLVPFTALGILAAFAALGPRYIPKLATQNIAIYTGAATAGAFLVTPTVAGLTQVAMLTGRRAHQAYAHHQAAKKTGDSDS